MGQTRIRHGVLIGAAISVPAIIVSFFAAGFGHGTYVPMILLFPYTMLWAAFVQLIRLPAIGLAVIQFPAYGALIGWSAERARSREVTWILVVIHLAVAAMAIARNNRGTFL